MLVNMATPRMRPSERTRRLSAPCRFTPSLFTIVKKLVNRSFGYSSYSYSKCEGKVINISNVVGESCGVLLQVCDSYMHNRQLKVNLMYLHLPLAIN